MESEIIKQLLDKRQLWDKIVLEELDKKHIGDIMSKEIVFLCTIGRLVTNKQPYSFNLIAHSVPSAGKDHLIKSVLNIFPKEDIYFKTRITEMVLNYWEPYLKKGKESWDGGILYLIDASQKILDSEALKVMSSEGSDITTMEKIAGKLEAIDKEIKGKPVIFTTTAKGILAEEMQNRYSILKLDESKEQTKQTFFVENEEYSTEIKEFIKNLKSYKVEIHFVKKIAKVFPDDKPRRRRDFQRFLDLVRAVALFHQDLKIKHRGGIIDADLEDYQIAKRIYENMCLGVADIPLSPIQKKITEVLEKAKEPLSVSEILIYLEGYITKSNLYPHLYHLENMGVLEKLELKGDFLNTKNIPTTKYSLSEEFRDKKPIKLPNSEEI